VTDIDIELELAKTPRTSRTTHLTRTLKYIISISYSAAETKNSGFCGRPDLSDREVYPFQANEDAQDTGDSQDMKIRNSNGL
jgi:hypothetical protein